MTILRMPCRSQLASCLILPGNPSNVNHPAEVQAQISRLFLRFPSITMTLAQPGKVHSWPTCVCGYTNNEL